MAAGNLHPYFNTNGGIDILISHFHQSGIWQKIDLLLGKRNARAEYSNSDVMQTWIINMLTGSNRLEHIYDNSDALKVHPNLKKAASPDTVSRVVRKLADDNVYYSKFNHKRMQQNIASYTLVHNPTNAEKLKLNEVNNNPKLNSLLIETAINLALLKPGQEYELDIDATFIPTCVSDSRIGYTFESGYSPMVVLLGGIPIYMESRNGNSVPMFRKLDVLKDAIELIESKGLEIKFVRIDAAGSSKNILKFLNERNIKFFIRAHSRYKKRVTKQPRWTKLGESRFKKTNDTIVNMDGFDVRAIEYLSTKKLNEDGMPRVWGILTNDKDITALQAISVYNKRAGSAIEHRFSDLKEMGWHFMVHRELKYNTVHMFVTMLAYIFFIYAKRWLAGKLPFIKENIELKTFIKKFICVVTIWVNDKLKFLNREREFKPLSGFT